MLGACAVGRSPKDKRVVREASTQDDVWWGGSSPNFPMKEEDFVVTRQVGPLVDASNVCIDRCCIQNFQGAVTAGVDSL